MGIDSLVQVAVLSGAAIATVSLPGAAIDLTKRPNPEFIEIAQVSDVDCRQTNAVTGVYQQPDPVSVSQGVLAAGQNVRLEVVGTGTGWSRIREPIVGWVEARYLTPPTPCAYASTTAAPNQAISQATSQSANQATSQSAQASPAPVSSTAVTQASGNPTQLPQVNPPQPVAARSPINSATSSNFPQPNLPQPNLPTGQVTVPPLTSAATQTFPQPIQQNNVQNNVAVRPTVQPLPAIVPQTAPAQQAIVTTTCDVLPREGLVVRQQPDLNNPGFGIIPAGTYNFQFTGATQTIGRQRLAYIVAPTQGWIPVLTSGGVSTLGGGRCG